MSFNKHAWILITGNALSLLGDQILLTSLMYLAARDTGSLLFTASFALLSTLSLTLLGPVGGSFMDHRGSKLHLIGADLLRALLLVLLVVFWTNPLQWPAVLGIMAGLSALSGFFNPGFRALMPLVVPRDHLLKFNSWNTTATRVATLTGPLIGGLMVSSLGIQAALWLDAASFVLSALCLIVLKVPRTSSPSRAPRKPVWSLLRNAALRRYLILASVVNAGISVFLLMLPAAALTFQQGGTVLGALQSSYQAGMLTAGVWLGVRQVQVQRALGWGLALMAASVLLFSVSAKLSLALAGALCFGAALMFTSLLADTTLQKSIPSHQMAGGYGVVQSVSAALRPFSIVLGGFLLDQVGLLWTGIMLTCLLLGTALFALLRTEPDPSPIESGL
ncbi:MFS transporter [Deinococcus cellulosilyticus]|uniref:MFS transporter n=1 Tax=Deinococcus cellulosilyticus (strain DSM 18568 / NBRC 106333 / KACC 11606 / 5516J-15) TaxID=1223518 RepID=A0A511MUT3_DEIC1|nr:MFS transporter [Deinococcus cellulosilyticus]GEM44374.1 hypothetical protein DC3_00090 [Deinococcus cellulosilyticus NBRC 106333 = KACC 11606]